MGCFPTKHMQLHILSWLTSHNLSFSQSRICSTTPPSKVVEIFWKMRYVLYSMGKIIKKYAIFIFRVMGENSSKIGVILSTKMTITRKIKIGNLVFILIQPIPDRSCKIEHSKKNVNFFFVMYWTKCWTKRKFQKKINCFFLVGGQEGSIDGAALPY